MDLTTKKHDSRSYNDDTTDGEGGEITIPRTKISTVDTYGMMSRMNTARYPFDDRVKNINTGEHSYYNYLVQNYIYPRDERDIFERAQQSVQIWNKNKTSAYTQTTDIEENTFVDTDENGRTRSANQPLVMGILDNTIREDTETYEIDKFDKNAMIIFNHENFWSDLPRRGTALDVTALENTFKQFRFEVKTHNDLRRRPLFDVLNEFRRRDYTDYGCLCVAILTHGLDEGYLKAADTRYREREAFACFDCFANPSLVGKPIIFLIQACRGEYPAGPVYHDVEFDAASKEVRPSEADIIIFHSSFFGRASVRVVREGTWFIQTVCDQMKRHAGTGHLEKVFRRVRKVVALEKEYEGTKQMPVVTTTLLKKLYLGTTKLFDDDVTLSRVFNINSERFASKSRNYGMCSPPKERPRLVPD